jgi:hypothetical protein
MSNIQPSDTGCDRSKTENFLEYLRNLSPEELDPILMALREMGWLSKSEAARQREPPFGVTVKEAGRLLADRARCDIYKLVGMGLLDARKDGNKTIVTWASLKDYFHSLPPAQVKRRLPRKR